MIKSVEYQYKLSRDVAALMLRNQFDQIARLTIAEDVEKAIVAHLEKTGGLVLDPEYAARAGMNKFNGIPFDTSKWLPPSILAVAYNRAGVIIGIIKKDEENVEAQGKE